DAKFGYYFAKFMFF
ncbi:hypothetical protein D043_0282B, partial [Vibrio parahaemolyticus EKP-021]